MTTFCNCNILNIFIRLFCRDLTLNYIHVQEKAYSLSLHMFRLSTLSAAE